MVVEWEGAGGWGRYGFVFVVGGSCCIFQWPVINHLYVVVRMKCVLYNNTVHDIILS